MNEWQWRGKNILDGAKEDKSRFVAMLLDGCQDVLSAQRLLTLPRPNLDDGSRRVKAMEPDLRLNHVLVVVVVVVYV